MSGGGGVETEREQINLEYRKERFHRTTEILEERVRQM